MLKFDTILTRKALFYMERTVMQQKQPLTGV